MAALLDAFDDASGTAKGTIRIVDPNDDTKWLVFAVSRSRVPVAAATATSRSRSSRRAARHRSPTATRSCSLQPGDSTATVVGLVRQHRLIGRRLSGADTLDRPLERVRPAGRSRAPTRATSAASPSRASRTSSARPATTTSSSSSRARQRHRLGRRRRGRTRRARDLPDDDDRLAASTRPARTASGTVTQFGKTVAYSGLDQQEVIERQRREAEGLAARSSTTRSCCSDADPNSLGQLKVRFEGIGWYDSRTVPRRTSSSSPTRPSRS